MDRRVKKYEGRGRCRMMIVPETILVTQTNFPFAQLRVFPRFVRSTNEHILSLPVRSYRFCRVARPSRLYSSLQRGLFERLTVDLCLIYAPPRSPPQLLVKRRRNDDSRPSLPISPSLPRHVGKSRHN